MSITAKVLSAEASREEEKEDASTFLKGGHVWLLAFGTGGMVANIYYIQPLLSTIAADFRISLSMVGLVALLSQLGTALGMLLFVPLGDIKERRSLMVRLAIAASLCLAFMATAHGFWWLALASFGVGLTGSIVHVIIPYAAHLAHPERRGSIVGTVMSGLLLGILLARTLSGLMGAWFGWRSIYWLAAALMLIIATLFQFGLPSSLPAVKMSWLALIRSAGDLVRRQPTLREAALLGAVFFGSFSAFWTTLTFFLQHPPYHYGSDVAGLFGLVGAVGAAAAPMIGRMADRYGARGNVLLALVVTLLSFVVMYAFGMHIAGLITGIILLDFGVQAGHVSNQTRIYALVPEARSRLNMVYMISYFTAGAIGSYTGTMAWEHFGWAGVCGLGGMLLVLGLIIQFSTRKVPCES
jgi:predicted MFS family arabinose efflux permease